MGERSCGVERGERKEGQRTRRVEGRRSCKVSKDGKKGRSVELEGSKGRKDEEERRKEERQKKG